MESVRLTSLRMAYFPLEMLVTVALGRLLTRVHPLRLVQRFYLLRVTMALLTALFIHALPGGLSCLLARRCGAGTDGALLLSARLPPDGPQQRRRPGHERERCRRRSG